MYAITDSVDNVDHVDIIYNVRDDFKHFGVNLKQYQTTVDKISKNIDH